MVWMVLHFLKADPDETEQEAPEADVEESVALLQKEKREMKTGHEKTEDPHLSPVIGRDNFVAAPNQSSEEISYQEEPKEPEQVSSTVRIVPIIPYQEEQPPPADEPKSDPPKSRESKSEPVIPIYQSEVAHTMTHSLIMIDPLAIAEPAEEDDEDDEDDDPCHSDCPSSRTDATSATSQHCGARRCCPSEATQQSKEQLETKSENQLEPLPPVERQASEDDEEFEMTRERSDRTRQIRFGTNRCLPARCGLRTGITIAWSVEIVVVVIHNCKIDAVTVSAA